MALYRSATSLFDDPCLIYDAEVPSCIICSPNTVPVTLHNLTVCATLDDPYACSLGGFYSQANWFSDASFDVDVPLFLASDPFGNPFCAPLTNY
jgi:hypothetical protein